MSQNDLPQLLKFDEIKDLMDAERKAIFQVNELSSGEDDLVRDKTDALVVLDFLNELQTKLWNFFNDFPSLISLFNKEFLPFSQFVSRSNVLDLIFLDDCLLPEQEKFFFGQDGLVNPNILGLHIKSFEDWMTEKKTKHEANQKLLRENFSLDIKSSEMECQCTNCIADYRTKLREHILELSLEEIREIEDKFKAKMDDLDLDEVASDFMGMQKGIEKLLHRVRYRLKRSTINRLESQIKSVIKERFNYPSELSLKRQESIMPYLKELLYDEDIKDEIVGEEEYKKFFGQISTGIWKNRRYLAREFKKLVRSVMVLKRKDISGKILQEYIGEFWVHSQARTIKRKIVYHMGPTNSGKTYHAIQKLASVEKGCYLAPLRLLAAELYDTLNQKEVKTTLLTGEEVIEIDGATHYASTIEMARLQEYFNCCVIDEIQMITDKQRGWAWTRALVNIFAEEVHLCGDPSALDLIKQIVELCGDELIIKKYERMTSLEVEKKQIGLGDMQKNDALIVFSRRNALRYKRDLERLGFKVSIVYGRLSPEVRREQARKFDMGETDIMVATDAISMGMNLPIRRIVFSTLSKFINSKEYEITESEIKQIAGRAGRFNRFPTGFVTTISKVDEGIDRVNEALVAELEQQTKCMVGPDLDIFSQVNGALEENGLPSLKLSEFLRLFNTMTFQTPFFCVQLKEMIELAEMVEDADIEGNMSNSEIFGFACAPVNLGLMEHVQYFVWILNHFATAKPIPNEAIDYKSNDIDYLETSIKCVELYQWLSRHFNNKHFIFDENILLENKSEAIDKLNTLLSDKIVPTCSSCGVKMPENSKFNICEKCFKERRFARGGRRGGPRTGGRFDNKKKKSGSGKKKTGKDGKPDFRKGKKKPSRKRRSNKKF